MLHLCSCCCSVQLTCEQVLAVAVLACHFCCNTLSACKHVLLVANRSYIHRYHLCKCRCIKPNFKMELGKFDNRYVVDQLQCLGILQTCEVSLLQLYIYCHVCTSKSCSCALLSVILLTSKVSTLYIYTTAVCCKDCFG
jgi:hypothetical protein